MEEELKAFRAPDGSPYRLIPLPWPKARFDEQAHRLPATYANFLVINGAVLVPTYRDRKMMPWPWNASARPFPDAKSSASTACRCSNSTVRCTA